MAHEFSDHNPHPGTDPVDRLRHVLIAFEGAPDDDIAVMATSGVYGKGVLTGLTWGDLRKLYVLLRDS